MEVNSIFLIRVSSQVDKDVDHPQFYDPLLSVENHTIGFGAV